MIAIWLSIVWHFYTLHDAIGLSGATKTERRTMRVAYIFYSIFTESHECVLVVWTQRTAEKFEGRSSSGDCTQLASDVPKCGDKFKINRFFRVFDLRKYEDMRGATRRWQLNTISDYKNRLWLRSKYIFMCVCVMFTSIYIICCVDFG